MKTGKTGENRKHRLIWRLGACMVVLSLAPLLWAGFRILDTARLNVDIQAGFHLAEKFEYSDLYNSFLDGGYRAQIPVKDMAPALESYSYLGWVVAVNSAFTQETVELPMDLTYYAGPSRDSAVAFSLKKGETVVVMPQTEASGVIVGYGCVGFPDYQKGWRCVRPFMKAGGGEKLEELSYFYIPMADLETVLRKYTSECNGKRTVSIENENLFIAKTLRLCDWRLYEHGIYNSPDLQYPIWDPADTLLASIFAVLLVSGIALLLMGRKGQKAVEGAADSQE